MLLLERTPASAASPRRRLPWCTPILPGSTVRLSRTCHAVPCYRERATALAASAPRDRAPLPAVPPRRRVPYSACAPGWLPAAGVDEPRDGGVQRLRVVQARPAASDPRL